MASREARNAAIKRAVVTVHSWPRCFHSVSCGCRACGGACACPICTRKETAVTSEDLAKHLSWFVPTGFVLTKQSELDRLHNECEALRIERDAARSTLAALGEENER